MSSFIHLVVSFGYKTTFSKAVKNLYI